MRLTGMLERNERRIKIIADGKLCSIARIADSPKLCDFIFKNAGSRSVFVLRLRSNSATVLHIAGEGAAPFGSIRRDKLVRSSE